MAGASEARPSRRAGALKVRRACSKGIELTNVGGVCAFAAMRWHWARVAEVLSRVQAGWRKSAACAFGCDAALGVSRRMRFPARGSEGILACFARCLHAFVS